MNNAFLNGDLQEDVYMKQPPGFESLSPNLVCKLQKALYGLKQAPRSWFQNLSSTLQSLGFHATKSDTSLFVKFMPSYTIYVLIYVDDIIITGSSKREVTTLISQLRECFALKDLGPIHYLLGIEVTRSQNGDLLLSQSKYITDLLRRTNMLSANPLPTPMQFTLRLQQDASSAMIDPTLYRSVVGTLQYILITRPELAFAVNKVFQFMHNPQDHHWKAMKRILRYLAGTSSHGLLIKHNSSSTILAFSDADWGSDMDDRKSTT